VSSSFPTHRSRTINRRRLLAGAAMLGLGGALIQTGGTAAQSQDPFTYIRAMDPTDNLGQKPGQTADGIDPVCHDNTTWRAYIRAPIKSGQDFHFTCEFDSSWIVLKANGFDLSLDEQLKVVGVDDAVEPWYEEHPDNVIVYGGDIAVHYCGNYRENFLARARGRAMRKVFDHVGLQVTPVHGRMTIQKALLAGQLVWFKSTVDFLNWVPATWQTPKQQQYPVVLGNDHALVVMGFDDDDVIIRDPLGPTSTNWNRPYQYRVAWQRFLPVFAAQGNDGLAVGPKPKPKG
jgi:hypothetical protein